MEKEEAKSRRGEDNLASHTHTLTVRSRQLTDTLPIPLSSLFLPLCQTRRSFFPSSPLLFDCCCCSCLDGGEGGGGEEVDEEED